MHHEGDMIHSDDSLTAEVIVILQMTINTRSAASKQIIIIIFSNYIVVNTLFFSSNHVWM